MCFRIFPLLQVLFNRFDGVQKKVQLPDVNQRMYQHDTAGGYLPHSKQMIIHESFACLEFHPFTSSQLLLTRPQEHGHLLAGLFQKFNHTLLRCRRPPILSESKADLTGSGGHLEIKAA